MKEKPENNNLSALVENTKKEKDKQHYVIHFFIISHVFSDFSLFFFLFFLFRFYASSDGASMPLFGPFYTKYR